MTQAEIGIIGGSGLYEILELEDGNEVRLSTPFGDPSDYYVVGSLGGRRVAFLARHGRGHRLLPSELNFRANIFGFKKLGVSQILSASAVGSLREEHAPMDFVLPDQFFDRTRLRTSTFFGEGIVAHISFAEPVCQRLAGLVMAAGNSLALNIKQGGTYVCMEGPAFSTRAESNVYRGLGMDLIGMTNLQEAKLAREAEICYVTIAMVTDYDCWHEEHDDVTVEMLIGYLTKNSENARRLMATVVPGLPGEFDCPCRHALKDAIITAPELVPEETRKRLEPILGRYL